MHVRFRETFLPLLIGLVVPACSGDTSAQRNLPEADASSSEDTDAEESTTRDTSSTDETPSPASDTGGDANAVPDAESDATSDTASSRAAVGASCEENADCRSGRCEDFSVGMVCTSDCRTAADCTGESVTCFEGRCTPNEHCLDRDGDGYGEGPGCKGPDCDDDAAEINPGAVELCGDDTDNDCDGGTDEGFPLVGTSCTVGVGSCRTQGTHECSADKLRVVCSAQADSPGTEVCNGLDDDCDGSVDEDAICKCKVGDTQPCYPGSADTRGVGICADGQQTCQNDGTWGKCKGATTPKSKETCNGRDDDCNGRDDDLDKDGDGYSRCESAPNVDCDDSDPDVHPGALETCNQIDDNCNGLIDERVRTTYFKDNDGDGWGTVSSQVKACSAPKNHVDQAGDCNDNNKKIHPKADEVCNDVDDNCDGLVDNGLKKVQLYRDNDGDTYGTPSGRTQKKCLYDRDGDGKGDTPPVNWSTNEKDCDDSNTTVYPDAEELCDGIKNDCSADVADWPCPKACSGSWPKDASRWSRSPKLAQLDGDTELEVVHSRSGLTRVWEHDGTLKWKANVGQRKYTFADFDDDNTVDMAIGDRGRITILNGEDGSTLKTISMPVDARVSVVFDFDNDGDLDIAPSRGGEILLLKENLSVQKRVSISTSDNKTVLRGVASADTNEDGQSEFFYGSLLESSRRGSQCDRRNGGPCRGRIYLFDTGGNTLNDPTWQSSSKPHFKPKGFPDPATSGRKRIGDVDGDGSSELITSTIKFTPDRKWLGQIWNMDGSQHAMTPGSYGGRWGAHEHLHSLVPLDKQGRLDTSTRSPLKTIRTSPVVDMDGDGVYERFSRKSGFTRVSNAKHLYDDSRIPDTPWWQGEYTVGDIDGDRGMELLFQNGGGEKIFCYSFPSGTWGRYSVESFTPRDPYGRHYYRTYNLDPYEPNDPGSSTFEPTKTTDPIEDSRAFDPKPLRWRPKSAGWWVARVRGLISSPDDVDYYVWQDPRNRGWLVVRLRDLERNYDLEVHVYDEKSKSHIKTLTSDSSGTSNEGINCRPSRDANCPKGDNIYIVEVRPDDPQKDWGSFPYDLRFSR